MERDKTTEDVLRVGHSMTGYVWGQFGCRGANGVGTSWCQDVELADEKKFHLTGIHV